MVTFVTKRSTNGRWLFAKVWNILEFHTPLWVAGRRKMTVYETSTECIIATDRRFTQIYIDNYVHRMTIVLWWGRIKIINEI